MVQEVLEKKTDIKRIFLYSVITKKIIYMFFINTNYQNHGNVIIKGG